MLKASATGHPFGLEFLLLLMPIQKIPGVFFSTKTEQDAQKLIELLDGQDFEGPPASAYNLT